MLETMAPSPVWDADAHEEAVETLASLRDRDGARILVWGGDWCGDCRATLPEFGAAVEAAGVGDLVETYPVDREKEGELVAEYGVERIPTIVVEVGGEELARFVESAPVGAAEYLADGIAGQRPGGGG
jgi:thiol-disulfide isomerase/thioredoxin